jgi:hypothetical protein
MGSVDPESLRISQMLREMSNGPEYSVPVTALHGLDVPVTPGRLDDMDAATLKAVQKANNSYMGLESGRTLNLRNQNTPLNQIRRDDILSAAQDSVRSAQEAAAQEAMARKMMAAAAAGGGLMVGDSLSRMQNEPMVADDPTMPAAPDPMEAMLATDIPIDDSYEPVFAEQPVQKRIATDLPAEQLDFLNDDPMATADLVQESRPIPASTPRIPVRGEIKATERLTPEEIARLRPMVTSIRDAKTGQAMDSFYPPESEEYKAEQRAKQRYSNLRYR